MATYSITVYSGRSDVDGSEWASQVYLTMFGTRASSPELEFPGTGHGEPDTPTTHMFDLADLGDLQRVRVRHDDTGVGPGWHLDRIVVQAAGTLQEWTFLCQRWLARHEDDGATERTLDVLSV